MTPEPLTYRSAGVDIEAADRLVDAISTAARKTHGPQVEPGPGAFAAMFRVGADTLLAATCDGVGTKLLVARETGSYEGIGRDLVAMNVNDLLVVGARPLFFLDYVAAGSLEPGPILAIVTGAAAACTEAGCALLGGETAEMPGLYQPGDLDVAGFAVGIVDPDLRPHPDGPRPGDRVLARASSGVHANGLSLARAAARRAGVGMADHLPELGRTLGEALGEPTLIYVDAVLGAPAEPRARGFAHVTGGGIAGRGAALAGDGLRLHIERSRFEVPPVFGLIQRWGGISDAEMTSTFNMGLGFLAVADPDSSGPWIDAGWIDVGEIGAGERGVEFHG